MCQYTVEQCWLAVQALYQHVWWEDCCVTVWVMDHKENPCYCQVALFTVLGGLQ